MLHNVVLPQCDTLEPVQNEIQSAEAKYEDKSGRLSARVLKLTKLCVRFGQVFSRPHTHPRHKLVPFYSQYDPLVHRQPTERNR